MRFQDLFFPVQDSSSSLAASQYVLHVQTLSQPTLSHCSFCNGDKGDENNGDDCDVFANWSACEAENGSGRRKFVQ